MQGDVSLAGYDKHRESAAAPGPLSKEEEEREEVRIAQSHVAVGVDTKHQTMSGLAFPLTDSAIQGLSTFKSNATDYVQVFGVSQAIHNFVENILLRFRLLRIKRNFTTIGTVLFPIPCSSIVKKSTPFLVCYKLF